MQLKDEYNTEDISSVLEQINKLQDYTRQIRYMQNELKDANTMLEQKVKDRTIELEKALQIKTEILNNISHEIRTPLHGFTVISESLVEYWKTLSSPKKLELAKQIADNARRLRSLISNLLDLSILSNHQLSLELEEFDFNQKIEDVINECKRIYIAEKALILEYHQTLPLKVTLDSTKIRQVVFNLLINAIHFANQNTTISLYSSIKDNVLFFTITDQGIGIPKGELESIFDQFVQSSNVKTKAGGRGLGLAICQKIIEAHGGKICAENNVDGGASFHFTIPLKTQTSKLHQPKTILLVEDEDVCVTSSEAMLEL